MFNQWKLLFHLYLMSSEFVLGQQRPSLLESIGTVRRQDEPITTSTTTEPTTSTTSTEPTTTITEPTTTMTTEPTSRQQVRNRPRRPLLNRQRQQQVRNRPRRPLLNRQRRQQVRKPTTSTTITEPSGETTTLTEILTTESQEEDYDQRKNRDTDQIMTTTDIRKSLDNVINRYEDDKQIVKYFNDIMKRKTHPDDEIVHISTSGNRRRVETRGLPPNNRTIPFTDLNRRMELASHGLYFHPTGRAFVVEDYWIHLIRIPFIKKEVVLQKMNTEKECEEFFEETRNQLGTDLTVLQAEIFSSHPNGHPVLPSLIPSLKKLCEEILAKRDKSMEETQMIIDEAFRSLQDKHGLERTKRFAGLILGALPILAGAVAGGVAGWFAAKHVTGDMQKEINEMKVRMGTLTNEMIVNNQILVGLSNEVTAMEQRFNQKAQLLSDNLRFQMEILNNTLTEILKEQVTSSTMNHLRGIMVNYASDQLSKSKDVLLLFLDQIRDWDEILTTIKENKLSRNLIGIRQLKKLLENIQGKLQNTFSLSIDSKDLNLYYRIPLTSYQIENQNGTDYLYIQMMIPLRSSKSEPFHHLYSPQASAFPCLNDFCILNGQRYPERFQKFELEQTLYLIGSHSKSLDYEIDPALLDCLESDSSKTCYVKSTALLSSPSMCSRGLYEFNETTIVDTCKVRVADEKEYKVLQVTDNLYLIHQEAVRSVLELCGNRMETLNIENWATTLSIKQSCEIIIRQTRQRIYGPFSDMKSAQTLSKTGYQSTLIKKLNKQIEESEPAPIEPINKTMPHISRLIRSIEENANKSMNALNELNKTLNPDELSDMAVFNIRTQKILKDSLSRLETKFTTITYHSSFWSWFSVFAHGLQMTTTLMIIFGALSYSNIFGIFGATVIVMPTEIAAFDLQLIPNIKLLPDIELKVLEDTLFISFVISCVFAAFFVLFLLFCIFFGTFRTVYFSQHWARYSPGTDLMIQNTEMNDDLPCHIILHLSFNGFRITHVKYETIHLKVTIDHLFTSDTFPRNIIRIIEIKNPVMYWAVKRVDGHRRLVMSEKISLIGLDGNFERRRNYDLLIDIPIPKQYTSRPYPRAFSPGNHGMAFITILKKQRRFELPPTMPKPPPRYIAHPEATAPLEE